MKLPWYLRRAPMIFGVVGVIKLIELFFLIVGYRVWSAHGGGDGVVIGIRTVDALINAFAWFAGATLAKLSLATLDRVESSHA